MNRRVPLRPDLYELQRSPHRSSGRDIYPVPG